MEKRTDIDFEIFRAAGVASWEKPMAEAAAFAATLNREQIINISHSSDNGQGTVAVWYVRSVAA